VLSLRRSRSSPLVRLTACILVPALVLAAIPSAAGASLLGQNPSYPIQDELYRLTSDTVTIGALNQYSKGFTYDDVGNRQTQTTTIGPAGSVIPGVLVNGTQAYTYDDRDRLLTETLGANPATAYTWDADGNLITKSGEAAYTWDREDRMVRVTKTDGTVVEHVYDFDGNRVQTTTTPAGGSAATTNYLVDTSGSLSQVVAETNGTGGLVAHYVRGDDLLAVMRPNGSGGWTSRFYHSDHIGSVRRLTDETGVVTDWYVYSAFGELLGHTGTDPQPYAFTGEPYDPNLGFQYHRARWIDPRVGRFTAMDAFAGQAFEPASLHKYSYAHSNPVSLTDPSGLFASVGEISIVNGLINVIAGTQARLGADVVIDLGFKDNAAAQMGRVLLDASGAAIGLSMLAIRLMRSGWFLRFLARFGCSFTPDTPVWAEHGDVPIGDLVPGDRVWAFDETSSTYGLFPVSDVLVDDHASTIRLTIADEHIETTAEHPFYTLGRGWVAAGDLRVGDEIRREIDGSSSGPVSRIEALRVPQAMFNLTVDTAHTFFVGRSHWLVHNACGLPDLVFPNLLPNRLTDELAAAASVGARPIRVGKIGESMSSGVAAEIQAAINQGTGRLKWVVTTDGELIVIPTTLRSVDISHAVMTNGAAVKAAGEVEIAAAGGAMQGIFIDNHSGHFQPSAQAEQIGRMVFGAFGIVFP
jgi:RHS repeat-associated protein